MSERVGSNNEISGVGENFIDAPIDKPEAPKARETDFQKELEFLINRYSLENDSDTPDFILAQFMHECLLAFGTGTPIREAWHGRAKNND